MNETLRLYLWQAYRRDVLGESATIVLPEKTPQMVAEAKQEIQRIDGLRQGASLSRRDFAAYQNRRALAELLAEWEKTDDRPTVHP